MSTNLIDIGTQLLPSTVDALLDEMGLTEYLNNEQCDISSSNYVPSINGWKTGTCIQYWIKQTKMDLLSIDM